MLQKHNGNPRHTSPPISSYFPSAFNLFHHGKDLIFSYYKVLYYTMDLYNIKSLVKQMVHMMVNVKPGPKWDHVMFLILACLHCLFNSLWIDLTDCLLNMTAPGTNVWTQTFEPHLWCFLALIKNNFSCFCHQDSKTMNIPGNDEVGGWIETLI